MMLFLLIHNIALRQCKARIGVCKWVNHSNVKKTQAADSDPKSLWLLQGPLGSEFSSKVSLSTESASTKTVKSRVKVSTI